MASKIIDYICINKYQDMSIRKGPGPTYDSIGKVLPKGTTIHCTLEENMWYKHDKGGWSSNEGWKFLSIIEDNTPAVTSKTTDLTNEFQINPILNAISIATKAAIDIAKKNIETVSNKIETEKKVKESALNNTDKIIKFDNVVNTFGEIVETEKKNQARISIDDNLGEVRGIYRDTRINLYNKFNRFGYLKINDRVSSTREYVFFTKPDLHIFDNGNPSKLNPELSPYPIFEDAIYRYPDVLKQLQLSTVGNKLPFMNLLYNTIKNTIDLPSITSKESETSSNIYGTKIYYRRHSLESDDGHEFNADFEDYKSIDTYMLFKLWDTYSNLKSLGIVTPPNIDYTINRVLHDQIGIYKFIVDEDGETILFYAYLLGCFPKSAPREAFSEVNDGLVYSIPFKSTVVMDSDPAILSDFNYIVKNGVVGNTSGVYSNRLQAVNPNWVTTPYIYKEYKTNKNGFTYKLKWKE